MKIVIVTKALAPYRARFYHEVERVDGVDVCVIVANKATLDHPWEESSGSCGAKNVRFINSNFGEKFIELVGRCFRIAGDTCLPTRQLIQTIKEEAPDILWVHEYSPFCLGAAVYAKLKGLPCVVSTDVGDLPPIHACSKLLKGYQNAIMPLFCGVIANTPGALVRRRLSPENIVYAPHAICVEDYEHKKERIRDCVKFLFVGRLLNNKGIISLINIFNNICSERGNFQLTIVGSGELADLVRSKADKYWWLDYRGFVEGEALRGIYTEHDVFVFPTLEDTYGVVVHEAMAASMAVVVSSEAGCVETLVSEGINGFVLEPYNLLLWRLTILRYIDNPKLAVSQGEQSRRIAAGYCIKKLGVKTAVWLDAKV